MTERSPGSLNRLALLTTALWLSWASTAIPSVSSEIDPSTLPVESTLAIQLRHHVQYLASPALKGRKPGTAGNRAAAAYIIEQFRSAALRPLPSISNYRLPVSSVLGDNLIGVRQATAPLNEASWLLVGAHYDHLGGKFLGADDNAAAVAVLVEIARALPPLRHHGVLFVAFNTEEPPYIRTPLMGSQHFMDHLPPEIGSPAELKAVIIMDLIGGAHWRPLQNVIFAAGAEKSPGLYRRLKQASGGEASGVKRETTPFTPHPLDLARTDESPPVHPLTVLPVGLHVVEEIPLLGQVAFSDYDAFRNAHVPFVFLSAGRTPRYHQTTDLPDTLHYERMAATVGWLKTLLQLIDQDTKRYTFEPHRIAFEDEVASFRPLVAHTAKWDTRIPDTSIISFWTLQRDNEWLHQIDPATPTPQDLKRLERISIRMQCLLADFPGCFLL